MRTREPGLRDHENDTHVAVERVRLSCAFSRCVSSTEAGGSHGDPKRIEVFTIVSGGTMTGLGTGRLCEMATGGAAAGLNGLSVTPEEGRGSGDPALLRPDWDMLGKVRCLVYERRGDLLKLELLPATETAGNLPPGFSVLPGKISSGTFVLQSGPASKTTELFTAAHTGAEPKGDVDSNSSTADYYYKGATSPLSMFIAAQGQPEELPPTNMGIPRAFLPKNEAVPDAKVSHQPPALMSETRKVIHE